MADPRIRLDVWKLADWDPILLWYARAVTEMQARPLDDPTSWRYQAAIHEYVRDFDPLAKPEDTLPIAGDQERFWNQCQHFSWYFLPWHRMYLAVFEEIVASTIVQLGGPAGWALPYWNYSDASNPNARKLPPAFRAATTPDGADNPLRVEERDRDCNLGNVIANDRDVDIKECLREVEFAASATGGGTSFGGPETGFNHSEGNAMGTLDRVPHGSMHGAVGGFDGWMSAFNTAALDPIFWLHHANIDRLWTVWLRRDPANKNPDLSQWLTALPFEFNDGTGGVVSITPSQVVDTTAMPWAYRYEDETDPLAAEFGPMESAAAARRREMARRRITEMVGATEEAVVLTGQPATTRISVSPPTGPARTAAESGAPLETYLNIENITGSTGPMSYSVYLNLPPGESPEDHPELLAGVLPMFGVREASRASDRHAGSGLHYVLRVGDIVRRLQSRNDWNPGDIRLTFVPDRRIQERETARAEAAARPIRVGRVSLHVG